MAIIFNIGESIKQSAFNILLEPIQMFLENQHELYEKESHLDKIYTFKTTDKYQEEYRSRTEMRGFEPTEDLEVAQTSDFKEGYRKVFRTQTWTNSFVVSKQTIEDNQDMNINQDAMGFIKSYGRTRELYGYAMLAGALAGSCTFGNKSPKKFDCRGMDTVDGTIEGTPQLYFHNAHKSVIEGVADQSNKFRAAIDLTEHGAHEKLAELIGIVETTMMNYTNYNGDILTVNPTRILVPNHYLLKDVMLTALKSTHTGFLGGNGVNIQAGKWEVLVSAYLNKHAGFAEADQAFIMIDPVINKENLGAVWFERKPLEVRTYIDQPTEAMVWAGRSRYGVDFGDFRAMAYVSTKKLGEGEDLNTVAAAQNATPITTSDRIKKVKVTNAEDFHEEEG